MSNDAMHVFIVGPAHGELTPEKIIAITGSRDADPLEFYFWQYHESGRLLIDWPFDRPYELAVVVEDANGIRVVRHTREEEKAGQLNRLCSGMQHDGGRVLCIYNAWTPDAGAGDDVPCRAFRKAMKLPQQHTIAEHTDLASS
jgi:hypothetical protein